MKLLRLLGVAAGAALLASIFPVHNLAQQGTSSGSVSRTRTQSGDNPNRVKPPIKRRGVSSAAVSRTRNSAGYYGETASFAFTPPDDVAVDEFINYHKHRLPLPKSGQSVAMDVRWGNNEISDQQSEAVLQIGFTTAEVNDRTDLRPLNLALVIDKSGSMTATDKMSRVKQALKTMFGQLRPDDTVSIVTFDTDAEVLLPATRFGDGWELRRAVDSIRPGGSTNLNAGLMLGYREAMKNYRAKQTNRVILLTDGIANVGTTKPTQIAQNSLAFNDEGVDLSTVGVGAELDTDLLRTLAKSGRGLYHFVAETEDIEKVFVSEIQSLISPVARQVELKVDYDSTLEIQKIYGYEPRERRNAVQISLDDMNNGLTQVVLMKFRVRDDFADEPIHKVKVRLSYFDFKTGRTVEHAQEIELQKVRRAGKMLTDVEVKKNYTIALLSQSLADMTAAARRGDYNRAESFLNASVTAAYNNYPAMEDKDINYVLNIVENYKNNLRAYNRQRGD
ncbi:MAG: VWA domain-containing protein [Pyrinomonadaceae bacterium]